MNSIENGTLLNWIKRNSITTLLSILLLLAGYIYGQLSAQVFDNTKNINAHEFKLVESRATAETRWQDIDRRLTRIENKIDGLSITK